MRFNPANGLRFSRKDAKAQKKEVDGFAKENSWNAPIQDPPGAIPLLFPGALLISGQWFPEVGRFCPFFLSSHGSGVDK